EKAKKLLADAGYPDCFEFDMVTRPDPIWELNTAQVLAEQFKDIGVKRNTTDANYGIEVKVMHMTDNVRSSTPPSF
ncbi:hypothetical protein AB9F39_39640, partial [Rhizobium leguminosarum]|uniref:hypothetical protein n=1 Tax=Rhizobium leguminosarum TaxID=384 RepID=UPI003F9CE6EC